MILTAPEEVDLWLAADAVKGFELQRALPDDARLGSSPDEREEGIAA